MGATGANGFPPTRTDTDRRLTIMPGHGPIRTTLNAGQVSTDLMACRSHHDMWSLFTGRLAPAGRRLAGETGAVRTESLDASYLALPDEAGPFRA